MNYGYKIIETNTVMNNFEIFNLNIYELQSKFILKQNYIGQSSRIPFCYENNL